MAQSNVSVHEDRGTEVRRVIRAVLGAEYSARTDWGAFHYIRKGRWWKRDIGYVLFDKVVCFGRQNLDDMTKLAASLLVENIELSAP